MKCLRTYVSCFFVIYSVSTNPCPQATDCSGCMQADPRCAWCLDDVSSRPVFFLLIFLINWSFYHNFKENSAQKTNFSIKEFFSKCEQICRKLRIWSHLLKKSLMENLMESLILIKLRTFSSATLLERDSHIGVSAKQYLGLIQMQRFCENRQPWQMELDIQKQYTKAFLNRVL